MKIRIPARNTNHELIAPCTLPLYGEYPNYTFLDDKKNKRWVKIRANNHQNSMVLFPIGTQFCIDVINTSSRQQQQVVITMMKSREGKASPIGRVYMSLETFACMDILPLYKGPEIRFED